MKLIFWNVCCGYCLSLSAMGRGKSVVLTQETLTTGRVYNHQESWGHVSCLPKLLRSTQLCFWGHSQLSDSGMHNCSAPVQLSKIIYCIGNLKTPKCHQMTKVERISWNIYPHTPALMAQGFGEYGQWCFSKFGSFIPLYSGLLSTLRELYSVMCRLCSSTSQNLISTVAPCALPSFI